MRELSADCGCCAWPCWRCGTCRSAAAQRCAAAVRRDLRRELIAASQRGTLTLQAASAMPPPAATSYETRAESVARWRASSSAAMRVERSVMEIDADGVRPLEWQLDDGKSGKRRRRQAAVRLERGTVTGEIEGKPVDLPLRAGPAGSPVDSDRRRRRAAARPGARHHPADRRQPHQALHLHAQGKTADARHASSASSTPIVYESTREGSNRVSRFWLAPSLEYRAGARRADPQGQGRDGDELLH